MKLFNRVFLPLSLVFILSACSYSNSEPVPATSEVVMPNDNTSVTPPSASEAARQAIAPLPPPADSVIVIQGVFDAAGTTLLKLEPVRRHAWRSGPMPTQQEGIFVVTVTYVTGDSVSVPFDALIADDSDPGVTQHGFFQVTIPISGKMASIRITDAKGETTFARIEGAEILQ